MDDSPHLPVIPTGTGKAGENGQPSCFPRKGTRTRPSALVNSGYVVLTSVSAIYLLLARIAIDWVTGRLALALSASSMYSQATSSL